jgi:DNA-binding XRE family transcriptional regulator
MTSPALAFKLTRESLWLSQSEAADWLGVSKRTLQEWESGGEPVPVKRREQLDELTATFWGLVGKATAQALDASPRPDVVALVCYTNDRDYLEAVDRCEQLPTSKLHRMLLHEVAQAIEQGGIPVALVAFNHVAYADWLGTRQDSPAMRAQWAAERVK